MPRAKSLRQFWEAGSRVRAALLSAWRALHRHGAEWARNQFSTCAARSLDFCRRCSNSWLISLRSVVGVAGAGGSGAAASLVGVDGGEPYTTTTGVLGLVLGAMGLVRVPGLAEAEAVAEAVGRGASGSGGAGVGDDAVCAAVWAAVVVVVVAPPLEEEEA